MEAMEDLGRTWVELEATKSMQLKIKTEMPKRTRTSASGRSFKKRRLARRRRRFHRRSRVVSQPRVISESQIVKLRYVQYTSLDPSTGTQAYDTWSATSLYDPYVGVGGHQPLGFDEWMTFYNHYQVLGAKCTAYANTVGESGSDPVWLVGQTSASTAVPATSIDQYIEQKRAKYTFLSAAHSSRSFGKVTMTYSPKRFFNLKNPRDEHDLRGDASNNPQEQCYFQVIVGGANPNNNPGAVNVRVVIDYVCLLTERKHLGQS